MSTGLYKFCWSRSRAGPSVLNGGRTVEVPPGCHSVPKLLLLISEEGVS